MTHVNIKDVCCLNAGGGVGVDSTQLVPNSGNDGGGGAGFFFFFCTTGIKGPFECLGVQCREQRAAGPQRGRVTH